MEVQSNKNNVTLASKDFDRLSNFIYKECGIKMPPQKRIMLEARLRKRLKELDINNYSEYCDYLFSSNGLENELIHMIDVVTTNKTDFFREPHQFVYLTEYVLPELITAFGAGTKKKLKIWSAGCSTGEEPYTLSIVLNEFRHGYNELDYTILGSDISTQVLEKAMMGIYDIQRIEGIPLPLKKKYFLKSKDKQKPMVRIIPELRKKLTLRRINFMDDNLGIVEKQDIIFCRNVIIYFDKETQEKLIGKLCGQLIMDGYLFVGHSETLFNMDLPLEQVAPSIYKKVR